MVKGSTELEMRGRCSTGQKVDVRAASSGHSKSPRGFLGVSRHSYSFGFG